MGLVKAILQCEELVVQLSLELSHGPRTSGSQPARSGHI